MQRRHPSSPTSGLPRLWLMTDERIGESLWPALQRLPCGSGVVFRHYGLPVVDRRALFARVMRIARRRRLVVVVANGVRLGPGADGVHGRDPRRCPGIRTWPAHDQREIVAGHRAGADLFFISPILPTRSHPGARILGWRRASLLARMVRGRAIALGGIRPDHVGRLASAGFYGWAAIDGLTGRPD